MQIKEFREKRRKEEMFGDPMKGNVLPEMLEPGYDPGNTNSFPISPNVELVAQNIPVHTIDRIGRN